MCRCDVKIFLRVAFKKAVDGRNFAWLRANGWRWEKRKDLLDDVIAKGAVVTVWFIQSVESNKMKCTCRTL